MSPEQANGGDVDARSDVFAGGILLWELSTGRRMYKAESGEGKNEALLELARKAEIPATLPRGLPNEEELCAIAKCALEKNRDDRFVSAAAMRKRLDAYVLESKLGANALKLGEWLRSTFGEEVLSLRRARERAIKALERGPAARIVPIQEKKDEEIIEPAPESLVATAIDLKSKAPPPLEEEKSGAMTYVVIGALAAAAAIAVIMMMR
jgi:eukaryotic-like serine/threonine-protein kinase